MRRAVRVILALGLIAAGAAAPHAADAPDDAAGSRAGREAAASRAAAAPRSSRPAFTAGREAMALEFVAAHHPELARLLKRLAPRNRGEYEKAIVELSGEAETLANLKRRDPRRYALALEVWKARSRVELLAAQLAGVGADDPARKRLEARLRAALAGQADAEIRRQRYERDQAAERLERLRATVDRMERDRGSLVEQRFQKLVREGKGRVERRGGRPAGEPSPAGSARPARDREERPR